MTETVKALALSAQAQANQYPRGNFSQANNSANDTSTQRHKGKRRKNKNFGENSQLGQVDSSMNVTAMSYAQPQAVQQSQKIGQGLDMTSQ